MNSSDFELETAISNVIKKQESRGTVISVIDGAALISGLKRVEVENDEINFSAILSN